MGYLSALHLHRMYIDYMGYSMDVTSTLSSRLIYNFPLRVPLSSLLLIIVFLAIVMVSVIKVTSFACNIRDGKLLSTPEQLTPVWQKYAVAKMPSPLEFISYLFYFPTFLAGPAFHFASFKQFIEGTLYQDKTHNPSGKEPSPYLATLITFGEAILCIVIHLAFSAYLISLIIYFL